MAKRFSDSDKWRKPWFRKLKPVYKLLWMYILDNCDHAGVWHVDFDAVAFHIGEDVEPSEATEHLKSQILAFDNGKKWFIVGFVDFQYSGKLNPENRSHLSVINVLTKYGLWENCAFNAERNEESGSAKKAQLRGLQAPSVGAKDKDKVTDKEPILVLDKDDTEKFSFEILWNHYGKKTDRRDAERAWRKLTDGEKERALQSVAAYVTSTPDKQFRKHLATWLNKKSFDNEIIESKTHEQKPSGERVATTDYGRTAEDYARELIANRPMERDADLRLAGSAGNRDTSGADNPNTYR